MSESIDGEWYAQYTALPSGEPVFEALRNVPDIDRKKVRFIADGFAINPDLTPEIDHVDLSERKSVYIGFHTQLAESSAPEVVKEAYLPLINAKILGLTCLEASVSGDAELFMEANRLQFGEVDTSIFANICGHYRQLAEDYSGSNQLSLERAAKNVLELLPEDSATAGFESAVGWDNALDLHQEFYRELFEGITLPETAKGIVIQEVIERVLGNLGYGQYQVKLRTDSVKTMSVNTDRQWVVVPADKQYSALAQKRLISHEVGVHVREAEVGKQQPLQIIGSGLQGGDVASEGRGLLVEQLVFPNWQDYMKSERFYGIANRHLSIGLALGLDGEPPRDFKQVFAVMRAFIELRELSKKPENTSAARQRATNKAWALLTQRTLKGVVGPGAAYLKDKTYAECNREQWQLITDHPEVMPYMYKGVYDLSKPEHIRILKRVGTLPDDVLQTV